MNIWRPVDAVGHAVVQWWSPLRQVRTGVLVTAVGLALIGYLPFSGEPPLIYLMSAVALVLAGLGILVTAVLALKEDDDASEDDLLPD